MSLLLKNWLKADSSGTSTLVSRLDIKSFSAQEIFYFGKFSIFWNIFELNSKGIYVSTFIYVHILKENSLHLQKLRELVH